MEIQQSVGAAFDSTISPLIAEVGQTEQSPVGPESEAGDQSG